MGRYFVLERDGDELLVSWRGEHDVWRIVLASFRHHFGDASFDARLKVWTLPLRDRRVVLEWASGWFRADQVHERVYARERARACDSGQGRTALERAYAALHLRESAPPWAVQALHRGAARHFHPDGGGDARHMVQINAAIEVLREAGRLRA